MTGLRASVLAGLWAVLIGCASVGRVPPPPDAARYVGRPEALWTRVESNNRRLQDLRAVVDVTLRSPEEQYAGKAVLLLQAGGSIRLEPLNFFGQPVLYIVAHEDRLEAYDPGKGDHFQGRASIRNLYRWLGIPLTAAEVVTVLWGGLPPPSGSVPDRVDWDGSVEAGGAYRAEWERPGGGRWRWWLDPVRFLPVRLEVLSAGRTVLRARYGNYPPRAEAPAPEDVRVEIGTGERTLDLHYRSIKLNGGLPPLAFHLPVPEGARVIPMDR